MSLRDHPPSTEASRAPPLSSASRPRQLEPDHPGLEDGWVSGCSTAPTRSVAPSEAGARLLARLCPRLLIWTAAVADVRSLRDARRARADHATALPAHFITSRRARPSSGLSGCGCTWSRRPLVDIVAERSHAHQAWRDGREEDRSLDGSDLEMMVVRRRPYIETLRHARDAADLRRHRCINFRWPTTGSLIAGSSSAARKARGGGRRPLIVNEPEIAIARRSTASALRTFSTIKSGPSSPPGSFGACWRSGRPPFQASICISEPAADAAGAACVPRIPSFAAVRTTKQPLEGHLHSGEGKRRCQDVTRWTRRLRNQRGLVDSGRRRLKMRPAIPLGKPPGSVIVGLPVISNGQVIIAAFGE